MSRRRLFLLTAALTVRMLHADGARANPPNKQECVAANETAQDLQRAGRLVEARQELETCAANACPVAVRTDCTERLQEVIDALPTVVLTPKDASGGDASTASLAIDGIAQTTPLDGKPVPVDPGTHTFTITLAGRSPVALRLTLAAGDHVRRDVVLRAEVSAGPVSAEPSVAPSEAAAPATSVAQGHGHALLMRRIGWAAIGAGAAGVTLGTIFGLLALGNKESLSDACHGRECPPTSQTDIDGLHFNGVAADIGFAVGILGVGAGGALLFLFPESPSHAPRDTTGGIVLRPWAGLGDVGVRGTFR